MRYGFAVVFKNPSPNCHIDFLLYIILEFLDLQ